jgi:hypothetical protein
VLDANARKLTGPLRVPEAALSSNSDSTALAATLKNHASCFAGSSAGGIRYAKHRT